MKQRKQAVVRYFVLLLAASLMALAGNGAVGYAGAEPAELKKFQLYATDGYVTMPDGNKVYIWGYSLQNAQGTAGYPAPTLEVNEGDRVEVTLTNIGPLKKGIKRPAHTIHWHGMDTDQANDGVPHTSPAIQVGESFTYKFTAKHAGTYFYHCHVDTIEHLQMAIMHGALDRQCERRSQTSLDGRVNPTAAAPQTITGAIMVPLSVVNQLIGAKVSVNAKTKQIVITAQVQAAMTNGGEDHSEHDGHTGHTGDDCGAGSVPGGSSGGNPRRAPTRIIALHIRRWWAKLSSPNKAFKPRCSEKSSGAFLFLEKPVSIHFLLGINTHVL